MKRLRSNRGTSLIEVLMSLGMFTIVAGSVTGALISNLRLTYGAQATSAAASLAATEIEQLRSLAAGYTVVPPNLTIGNHIDPANPLTAAGDSNGTFTRSWSVTAIPMSATGAIGGAKPGIVQVAVSVEWSARPRGKVTLFTYACTTPTCG